MSAHVWEGSESGVSLQYVGPDGDGVCFSKVKGAWLVCTHDFLFMLSQSHHAEADIASEEKSSQTCTQTYSKRRARRSAV